MKSKFELDVVKKRSKLVRLMKDNSVKIDWINNVGKYFVDYKFAYYLFIIQWDFHMNLAGCKAR